MTVEKTLILIKPDGVQRGLIGQILTRFEQAGLKIVGLKLFQADEEFAKQHYTEDITRRRGELVRRQLVEFLKASPVVAVALEGVEAIELVRKLVGPTEPKAAPPGTIRGDFAHVSYAHSDEQGIVVKNIIHASSSKEDAVNELALWFKPEELYSYTSVHDSHILS